MTSRSSGIARFRRSRRGLTTDSVHVFSYLRPVTFPVSDVCIIIIIIRPKCTFISHYHYKSLMRSMRCVST